MPERLTAAAPPRVLRLGALTLALLQGGSALVAEVLRRGDWRGGLLADPGVLALLAVFPLALLGAARPRRVVLASAVVAGLTALGGVAAAGRGAWPASADWWRGLIGDASLLPLASWSLAALGLCAAVLVGHALLIAAVGPAGAAYGRPGPLRAGILLFLLMGSMALSRPAAEQAHPLLAALMTGVRGEDDPQRLRWGRVHDDPAALAGLAAWATWRAAAGSVTVQRWRLDRPASEVLTPAGTLDAARWPELAARLRRGALIFPRVVQTGPTGAIDAWARAGDGFPVWQAATAPVAVPGELVLRDRAAADAALARRLDALRADPAAARTVVWLEWPMRRLAEDGEENGDAPPDRPGAWLLWSPGGDWPTVPVWRPLGTQDAGSLQAQLDAGLQEGPLAPDWRPGLRFFWYGRRAGDWGGLDGDWFFVHRAQGAAVLIDLARAVAVEDGPRRRLATYDGLAAAWLVEQAARFDARVGTPAPHRLAPAELSAFGLKRARLVVRAADGDYPVAVAHPDDALRLDLLWFGYPRVQDVRLAWTAPTGEVREQALAIGDELRAVTVPPPFPAPLATGDWRVQVRVNRRVEATLSVRVAAGQAPTPADPLAEPVLVALHVGAVADAGVGASRLRPDDRIRLVSEWTAGRVPWPAEYRLISPHGDALDLPFLLPEAARTQVMTLTPPVPLWPGAWQVELHTGAGRAATAGFRVIP